MSSQGPASPVTDEGLADLSPGLRFRRMRELADLSVADVAARLKLRSDLIRAIEREDLEHLGAPVFARGYISGYARLLGLPAGIAEELIPRGTQEDDSSVILQADRNSRGRYLFEHYTRRFVYVALTAAIVIPVILVATRDHLPDSDTLLTLPEPSSAISIQLENGEPGADPITLNEEVGPPRPTEQAVMASLTPFYAHPQRPAVRAPIESHEPPAGLQLEFTGDSWVEALAPDGSRLVHDLIRAGSTRHFAPGEVASIVLGNVSGVEARLDGVRVDLDPFQRANVARFAVSSDGLSSPSNAGE